jgi:hypothetical protein
VSHVAEEFPELCDAEREAFAEILGTHVQRLATIVNGDFACTTHVPIDPDKQAPGRNDPNEQSPRHPALAEATTTIEQGAST